eukprot:222853-Pelagomonas_calceolata.AAC.3
MQGHTGFGSVPLPTGLERTREFAHSFVTRPSAAAFSPAVQPLFPNTRPGYSTHAGSQANCQPMHMP